MFDGRQVGVGSQLVRDVGAFADQGSAVSRSLSTAAV